MRRISWDLRFERARSQIVRDSATCSSTVQGSHLEVVAMDYAYALLQDLVYPRNQLFPSNLGCCC